MSNTPRVAIVGAGFGGLEAAEHLAVSYKTLLTKIKDYDLG